MIKIEICSILRNWEINFVGWKMKIDDIIYATVVNFLNATCCGPEAQESLIRSLGQHSPSRPIASGYGTVYFAIYSACVSPLRIFFRQKWHFIMSHLCFLETLKNDSSVHYTLISIRQNSLFLDIKKDFNIQKERFFIFRNFLQTLLKRLIVIKIT